MHTYMLLIKSVFYNPILFQALHWRVDVGAGEVSEPVAIAELVTSAGTGKEVNTETRNYHMIGMLFFYS